MSAVKDAPPERLTLGQARSEVARLRLALNRIRRVTAKARRQKHTATPWKAGDESTIYGPGNEEVIYHLEYEGHWWRNADADQPHVIACVNACAAIAAILKRS